MPESMPVFLKGAGFCQDLVMVHHICSTAVPGTLQRTEGCVIMFRGHRAEPCLSLTEWNLLKFFLLKRRVLSVLQTHIDSISQKPFLHWTWNACFFVLLSRENSSFNFRSFFISVLLQRFVQQRGLWFLKTPAQCFGRESCSTGCI